MCNSSSNDPSLYIFLLQIDQELASETREKGCPHCGGVLHSACYPRKLKGHCVSEDGEGIVRFSFCCSTEGCRRRVTPPSVRFLGRKRYLGAVIVLLSAMLHGPSHRVARELEKQIGISSKTLWRWHSWWQETFPASRFWKCRKGLFMPPLDADGVCRSLVERFSAQHKTNNLIRLLRFLSPLSCPSPTVAMQAF